MLSYAIFPCIFKSLSGIKKVKFKNFFLIVKKIKKGAISLNLALFLIYEIFKNLNYSPLLEIILIYLFGFYIDKRISNLIANPIKPPCSYSFKWSFSNFWDDYPDLVAKHAEIQFLRKHKSSDDLMIASDDYESPKKNEKETEKEKDIETKNKQDPSIQMKHMDKFKKSIIHASNYLDFRNYFKSDILKYESEHRRLTKALGFLTIEKLHDSEEILQKSPMDLSKETFGKLINFISILKDGSNYKESNCKNDENLFNFEKNEFREILLSFLRVFFLFLFFRIILVIYFITFS